MLVDSLQQTSFGAYSAQMHNLGVSFPQFC
jgi:hypothetical protein